MRATLVSLTALSFAASAAVAQTMPDPAAPATAMPAVAPATTPTAAPTSGSPMAMPGPAATTTPSTAPPAASYSTAPMPAPSMPAPPPSTDSAMTPTTAPATDTTMAAAPPAAAPATPPAAPTDPAAIALISTLESVCVPAVAGGNLDKLTRTAGYHKSGDNYIMNGKGFKLTVLAPGSNPQTCHVDIVSAVDPEGPAKPIVVAIHNWAAVTRGYTLYRNDKNVTGAQELTTRSWELGEGGKNQAVVLTTFRKADGTPSNGRETSQMLFSTTATSAG